MRTIVDLINLALATALNNDVPNRVWTGKYVSYDYFIVFNYKVFVHIPKDERSKIDYKAKPCIRIR